MTSLLGKPSGTVHLGQQQRGTAVVKAQIHATILEIRRLNRGQGRTSTQQRPAAVALSRPVRSSPTRRKQRSIDVRCSGKTIEGKFSYRRNIEGTLGPKARKPVAGSLDNASCAVTARRGR